MKREDLLNFIKMQIAAEMSIDRETIREDDTFQGLGLDSISCIFILNKIEEEYKLSLNPIYFWDYPTVGAFTDYLLKEHLANG